jgi:23S rRNA (uracil1939-C5)-methyltransferase
MAKRIKNFDPVEMEIEGLHADGYGTTLDERVAVLGALPNETVTAEPYVRKRRKLVYKTMSVANKNPDRVQPMCAAAERCGGCSLQHFEPSAQIQFKHRQLVSMLEGSVPDKWLHPLTGPVRNYRSKARLGVKFVDKMGKVLVGFREKMKPYISEIDTCPVLRESVGERIEALALLVEKLSVCRALPQIEVAVGDSETALVFRHLEEVNAADLQLFAEFGAEHNVSIYLQPGNELSVHKIFPADGRERLSYSLPAYGLVFDFHPMDFIQINQTINRDMIPLAIELLSLNSEDNVFDAFCGIGNFSLPLATVARSVLGIEASESSVIRARENADRNNLKNTHFLAADLFAEGLDIPGLQGINKVLLDPPRSGAEEVCKKLATHKVERLVYVSCNPATLARDAKLLVESGYRFETAGVIDMFPHTNHVESIACFSSN